MCKLTIVYNVRLLFSAFRLCFYFWLEWITFCVHQCNRQQYIKTSPNSITWNSKELLSVFCLWPLMRLCSLGRENRQKKETRSLYFANSQTDIGYMGEAAAVHSRRGRDVNECWKQAWTVCCPSVRLADKTTSQWRCQNIWVRRE